MKTRLNMRSESDKLCRKYELTTIKKQSGLTEAEKERRAYEFENTIEANLNP